MMSTASNKFLSTLNVNPSVDRFIHIREGTLADSNFVLTYIIKEILSDDSNSLCLLNLHNTIGHFQNIGRRINYNLLEKVEQAEAASINILQDARRIITGDLEPETYMKNVMAEIVAQINKFMLRNDGEIYLAIDDLSHFLDLCIPYKEVVRFANFCVQLLDNDRVRIVVGSHLSEAVGTEDTMISNLLCYASDVIVSVSALKTGVCPGVSGIITIEKNGTEKTYHYKTGEKDVQVFNPGAATAALRI